MPFTDTDRLDFLLSQFRIDDVGDESYIPGIVINYEDLENLLTWGPVDHHGKCPTLVDAGARIRDIIDKAMLAKRGSKTG